MYDGLSYFYIIISLIITILSYMGYPFIMTMFFKKRYDEKTCAKMALWNSIIIGFIFCIISINNNGSWNPVPALFYYWINKKAWVYKNTSTENIKDDVNDEFFEDINVGDFICDNCGCVVEEYAKFCPKCGEKFEGSFDESNIENKYDNLIKLKELLDKKVITKEEFELEKKKILNK